MKPEHHRQQLLEAVETLVMFKRTIRLEEVENYAKELPARFRSQIPRKPSDKEIEMTNDWYRDQRAVVAALRELVK
jgi:hypothetical protein